MTMPHLMNCSHSEDGWCLACVKQMHAENEQYAEECRLVGWTTCREAAAKKAEYHDLGESIIAEFRSMQYPKESQS